VKNRESSRSKCLFQFAVHITADVHNPKFISPEQSDYNRMTEVKLLLGVTWQSKVYAMSGNNRQDLTIFKLNSFCIKKALLLCLLIPPNYNNKLYYVNQCTWFLFYMKTLLFKTVVKLLTLTLTCKR